MDQVFPNLSGNHLTLKYVSTSTVTGVTLYFQRLKLFKVNDRIDYDAVHPNLSGDHLSLKVTHVAKEDFLLAHISMGFMGYTE